MSFQHQYTFEHIYSPISTSNNSTSQLTCRLQMFAPAHVNIWRTLVSGLPFLQSRAQAALPRRARLRSSTTHIRTDRPTTLPPPPTSNPPPPPLFTMGRGAAWDLAALVCEMAVRIIIGGALTLTAPVCWLLCRLRAGPRMQFSSVYGHATARRLCAAPPNTFPHLYMYNNTQRKHANTQKLTTAHHYYFHSYYRCKVLVTGASSGIGAALALASARPGVRIVITGRNEGRLRATAAACEVCLRAHIRSAWCRLCPH